MVSPSSNSATSEKKAMPPPFNEDISKSCVEFQEKITSLFNEFRLTRIFTDITLRCEDGEFDAHSCILVASSGFFKELFRKQGVISSIRLPNIKSWTMTFLLNYIYTGNLQLLHSVQNLRDVLMAAKWLQVNDFYVHVSAIVEGLLNCVNYSDVWDVADEFDNCFITQEVLLFVTSNFSQLYATPLYLKLTVPRLEFIFRNRAFNKIPTYVALKSITSWVSYDKMARYQHISKLLSIINVNIDDVEKNNNSNDSMELVEMYLENANNMPLVKKTILPDEESQISLSVSSMERNDPMTNNEKVRASSPSNSSNSPNITSNSDKKYAMNWLPDKNLNIVENATTSTDSNERISPESLCYSWTKQENNNLSTNPQLKLPINSLLEEPWDSRFDCIHCTIDELSKDIPKDKEDSFPRKTKKPETRAELMAKMDSVGSNLMAIINAVQKHGTKGSSSVPQPKSRNLITSLFSPRSQTSDVSSHKNFSANATQTSPAGKGRIPRFHLTAATKLINCKENISDFAYDIAAEASDKAGRTPFDAEQRISDGESMESIMATSPHPVRYPTTKAEIRGMLAGTNRIKTISTPKFLRNADVLKAKVQEMSDSQPITAPIALYHPMFYLNRGLENSAFKPFVKSSSTASSVCEPTLSTCGMPQQDELPITRIPPVPPINFISFSSANSTTSTSKQYYLDCKSTSNSGESINNSPPDFNMPNHHSSISTWSRRLRNFDGSPYTEPVVAILGREKHGKHVMMCFNLDSHTWRLCENIEPYLKDHNLELFNNSGCVVYRNQVYLVGGEDKEFNQHSRVVILDLREGFGISLAPSLLVNRSSMGITVFQEFIYVVGGISFNRRMIDHAERYAFNTCEWVSVAPFPAAGWGMSLTALGDRLVSIGGRRNGEWSLGCYNYDPTTDQWTVLLQMPTEFDISYTLVMLYGNQVLAFRRRNNHNEAGSVAYLEPTHLTWTSPEVVGTPARRILSVVRHRHKVWVIDCSSKLHVYDPNSHTWENVYPFYRSVLTPLYAFIVYRAIPSQMKQK